MTLKMSATRIGERPRDGSSSMRRRGFPMSPRAIAAICCSPPESVPACCFSRSFSLGKIVNTFSSISGGEQQMAAIARGLMGKPRLLMLDEPSLGLSPILVADIFKVIQDVHDAGVTVLLVEQNVFKTLSIADRAYVLENGRIVLSGTGAALLADDNVRQAYLGL